MVEQGTLQMLSGTYPLEEILTYERCPGDYIIHVLGCTTCLRRFRLSVDTNHGSGGAWEVITTPAQTRTK